jgi:hypothetical protein
MTVQATYERPSSKEFKVISQSGSKLIANHVFKRLLESEKEAAQPAMSAKTQLNRDPTHTDGSYSVSNPAFSSSLRSFPNPLSPSSAVMSVPSGLMIR